MLYCKTFLSFMTVDLNITPWEYSLLTGETDEGSRHGGEQIKLQILLVYFINVPVWYKVGSLL